MLAKPLTVLMLLLTPVALSACAPLVGAGAAIGADQAVEDEGGNLF